MRKKLFSLLLILSLICLSGNVANAEHAKYTLNTDIVAYIDGAPIRSFNIDGFTGIVAEDLIWYGFGVYYDDDSRTLEIIRLNNKITSNYVPEISSVPVGSKDKRIYDTDIKTYVEGVCVPSFNIGGETIIFIDDLACYGEIVWNPNERKICYNYMESWMLDLYETNYESDLTKEINSFTLNWQKSSDGCLSDGENLDYLDYIRLYYDWQNGISFGFSLYQRTLFQTADLGDFLYQMVTTGCDGEVLCENADKANEHIKIYINDEEQKIVKASQGKGNGHRDYRFYLDAKIAKEDIKKLSVVCK